MTIHNSEKVQDLMNTLESMFANNISQEAASNIMAMTNQFFSVVSEDELLSRDISDLYGMILSFWRYISYRNCNETMVRVYNPNFEQHGWVSRHTVVEVCTEDHPFIVDTLQMTLNKLGIDMHSIMHIGGHHVKRDDDGKLLKQYAAHDDALLNEGCRLETLITAEIDRQEDSDILLAEIKDHILSAFDKLQTAVNDFKPMKQRLEQTIEKVQSYEIADQKEHDEIIAFLKWLDNDNFIFLGVCDLHLASADSDRIFELDEDSTLGILTYGKTFLSSNYHVYARTLDASNERQDQKPVLTTAKSDHVSPVHRPTHMDIVGVFIYDEKGNRIGERRFLGLYTSTAYHSDPHQIPFLRLRAKRLLDRSGFRVNGHSYKSLNNIIKTYPRNELFLSSEEELFETVMGMLHIKERPMIRLFVRQDIYERYYFCMLMMPREKYDAETRKKIQGILKEAFNSYKITFQTNFLESLLCRIDFVVYVNPKNKPRHINVKEIESMIVDSTREWEDEFLERAVEEYGENAGRFYYQEYRNSFTPAYKERYSPRRGVFDIRHFEEARKTKNLSMSVFRLLEEPLDRVRFKLFVYNQTLALSNVLPILENMGMHVVEEHPFYITTKEGETVSISDYGLKINTNVDLDTMKDLFIEAFYKIKEGTAENDRFNALITYSGLNWREVSIIRAYARYLGQIGIRFTQGYLQDSFICNPTITNDLIKLFYTRFDPSLEDNIRLNEQSRISRRITQALDQVVSLDQDKILRRMHETILATVRTNFFQTDDNGCPKPYISLKLIPAQIEGVPKPVPMFEIFMYSSRVEGVHLRGDKVARGGLRLSDRYEDYRTEVLGLVKAQHVKNAVVVPLGSKGGFVPKKLPASGTRDAIAQESVACYKLFISSLLDLTDNRLYGEVVPPQNLVRYDEDDPYLVVAADKGTATFSDIANEVAQSYGFWLGDAFASGASNGYDHKKMGITARGAWESVISHFKQMGKDCQNEDFTCVGIGDMGGDVFGNGMLLSKHIRLIGAFNHKHIFFDPDPDAATSYEERLRLFNQPGSTWLDYDHNLISEGGGVFDRSAKRIKLTKQMQSWFNTQETEMEPAIVIQHILKLDVELLWNGGIGTYVKASDETHAQVGDKANESVRVNGSDLKCSIIGEGGNLGLTQKGRVEFALKGGRVNTDAIDNSAGVDCSDHEVNIKILLNKAVENGELNYQKRNELLAQTEEEVASLVLQNNIYQNQTIANSIKEKGIATAEAYCRIMREQEREIQLDREIEFLPTDKQLYARVVDGKYLTAPEFSVVMAYNKILLKQKIIDSDIPDDPYFYPFLKAEFPQTINDKFEHLLDKHPLSREIIATQLANYLSVNMGVTFIQRVYDTTGAPATEIVKAFIAAMEIFDLSSLMDELYAKTGQMNTRHLDHCKALVLSFVRKVCRWLIRRYNGEININHVINQYQTRCNELLQHIANVIPVINVNPEGATGYYWQLQNECGFSEPLALKVATLKASSAVMEAVYVAKHAQCNMKTMILYFDRLDDRLSLLWFRNTIASLEEASYWANLSSSGLRDDLDHYQTELVASVINFDSQAETVEQHIDEWIKAYQGLVTRWLNMIEDIRSDMPRFDSINVASKALKDLTQASMYRPDSKDCHISG